MKVSKSHTMADVNSGRVSLLDEDYVAEYVLPLPSALRRKSTRRSPLLSCDINFRALGGDDPRVKERQRLR